MAEAARAASDGTPWEAQRPVAAQPVVARRPVWSVLVGVLATLAVVAAGFGAWEMFRPEGSGSGTGAGAGAAPSSEVPAGFDECAKGFCPAEPLCWGGLFVVSGVAQKPRQIVCTEAHAWETFAAVPATTDMMQARQDELMARPDVGAACSVTVMLGRAKTRAVTRAWVRDAVPIAVSGSDKILMHCIARPPEVESAAPAFA
ncbi:hypothetical protein AB0M20_32615, partial [Actinoplanes sp. NPDC051633]|uniref:hypothetical protein n=1 Tax=Actinoplanes sp. NPDC051633 TaxID=3155670 RepID=UPI0034224A18